MCEKLIYVPKVKLIIDSNIQKMKEIKKFTDYPKPDESLLFDDLLSDLEKVNHHAKISDPKRALK
jgi:hypothetical protein